MATKLIFSERINAKKFRIQEIWLTRINLPVKTRLELEQLVLKSKILIDIWITVMFFMTWILTLKKTRLTFDLIINNKLK